MTQQCLDDFFNLIAPFQHLWRSARFVGYAGKVGGIWLFLGGRIVLSEIDVPTERLTKIADYDDFLAFFDELPIKGVSEILRTIDNTENIHIDLGTGRGFRDIALCLPETPGAFKNVSRWPPLKFDRKSGREQFGVNSVGYRWAISDNSHINQLGAADCLQRASELLRRDTNLNGTDSLASQYTPGMRLNANQRPELQVVAPLLFRLEYDHNIGVRLIAPPTTKASHLKLKVFFQSDPAQEKVLSHGDHLPDDSFAVTWKFAWSDTADNADIHLLYCDREIEGISINKWAASATIRGAVNEYFDSNHSYLRKALEFQPARNSQDFEFAIVRLLDILGIPATWYGKVADPDRPDAAAVTSIGGSPVILLIECTREKPDQKFAPLAERVRHLRDFMKSKAEILPVVFTAAGISGPDLEAAFAHGVSVMGRDDINELLKLVSSSEVTPESVVDYLRKQAAKGSSVLSAVTRYSTRW